MTTLLGAELIVNRLGWVLVHSTWQFVVLALVAMALLRGMRKSSAAARYLALLGVMWFVAIAPVATWFVLPSEVPSHSNAASFEPESSRVSPASFVTGELPRGAAQPAPATRGSGSPSGPPARGRIAIALSARTSPPLRRASIAAAASASVSGP